MTSSTVASGGIGMGSVLEGKAFKARFQIPVGCGITGKRRQNRSAAPNHNLQYQTWIPSPVRIPPAGRRIRDNPRAECYPLR